MGVRLILCRPDSAAFIQEHDTVAAAFDALMEMIELARATEVFPMGRLRDQVLLNLASWLTDGAFSDDAEQVFTQLAVRTARSTTTNSVALVAAFGVADALDEAIADPVHWVNFDAHFAELGRLLAGE